MTTEGLCGETWLLRFLQHIENACKLNAAVTVIFWVMADRAAPEVRGGVGRLIDLEPSVLDRRVRPFVSRALIRPNLTGPIAGTRSGLTTVARRVRTVPARVRMSPRPSSACADASCDQR